MDKSHVIITFGSLTLFFVVLFFALINVAFYLIGDKYNLPALYDMHRKTWMPKRCEFCLFFWGALVELFIWSFATQRSAMDVAACGMLFGFALCAAVISRFFLK